jgi:hypothetical protein
LEKFSNRVLIFSLLSLATYRILLHLPTLLFFSGLQLWFNLSLSLSSPETFLNFAMYSNLAQGLLCLIQITSNKSLEIPDGRDHSENLMGSGGGAMEHESRKSS